MCGLREAIEDFRASLAQVYKVQPDRIIRDANAARRSAKDYTGRWFFELVQNCEDAHASAVVVQITDDAVYVADNGDGFRPGAVESISGTDFSDKPVGTIGRKGVGFKAVYEIATTPQLSTLDSEGLEFDPARAAQWLRQNGIDCPEDRQPYQWIPFFLSRREAEQREEALSNLREYSTVVRLPFKSEKMRELATKELGEWPSYALLPFEHVKTVRVTGGEMHFETSVERDHDRWILRDSRQAGQTIWRALRRSCSPPAECLADLDPDDRERVQQVGFLVAAPIGPDGAVRPADDPMPVHVFYPTKEPAPIRVLLHSEFLVKTDRTAIISIEKNEFNSWVADELADLVVTFINESYQPHSPAAYLGLLVPLDSRGELPVARELWKRILKNARSKLLLPDVNGERELRIGKAMMLSLTVGPGHGRRILASTPLGSRLIHEDIDRDAEARKALRELGCQSLNDQNITNTIEKCAQKNSEDREWIWACWRWLASWLAKKPWGDEREERLERLKQLPIVPVGATLLSAESLKDQIVTWRDDDSERDIPDWAPLTFVDDWFRHQIAYLDDDDPVEELLTALDVNEPKDDVLLEALKRAISQYWQKPGGDPSRFLRLLRQHRWDRQYDPPDGMARCPVLADVGGEEGQRYVEAGEAYFGRDWGETRLAELYDGVPGVAWAARPPSNADEYRDVLEWLSVQAWPRIVPKKDKEAQNAERDRVRPLVGRYYSSVSVTRVAPLALDRIDPKDLADRKAVALISLLAQNWPRYFEFLSQVEVEYTPRSRTYSERVPSLWWEQVSEQLRPPIVHSYAESVPLAKCWLPDKATHKLVGELIPIIDLAAFGNDADETREWLSEVALVRRTLDQISLDEWRGLLSARIPRIMPGENMADDPGKRDIVAHWYEACLHSLEDQEDVPDGALTDVPLLGRKGNEWNYIDAGQVWLADDEQLASAFRDDCWRIEIRSPLRPQARRLFGLRAYSEAVERQFLPNARKEPESKRLQEALEQVRPYVFAWRCSQTKRREPEKIRQDLLSLRAVAVDGLRVRLALPHVGLKEVESDWGIHGGELLVNAADSQSALASLGRVLAEALQAKTDARLYEILLGCETDAKRQSRLLFEGVMREELDRLLRLFAQEPGEQQVGGLQEEEEVTTPKVGLGWAPSGASDKTAEKTTQDLDSGVAVGAEEGTERELRLKDPDTAEIVVCATALQSGVSGGGSGGGAARSTPLTEEQRREIEGLGRRCATKRLEEMGYTVEQMPYRNPGFDLRCASADETLLVEVKGHLSRASIVDLTISEFREYSRCKQSDPERWELWNVEHLSQRSESPIIIRVYDTIPDTALSERTLRLDLRQCEPKRDHE